MSSWLPASRPGSARSGGADVDRYDRVVTTTRYRCRSCGNLTRFDVTTTQTVKAFHHYSVGGDLTVEEPEVLAGQIDEVVCRWCNSGDGVEELTETD